MLGNESRNGRLALLDHRRLHISPLRIDVRQPLRQIHRDRSVVGEETLDTEPHIVEAPRCVDPRRQRKAEIGCDDARRIAPGRAAQRIHASACTSCTHASQSRRDQHAIVRIERHQVGDRTERDEIEQHGKIRLGSRFAEPANLAQARAQRQHQIERHADTCDRLARKRVAGEIRIHDRVRCRQCRTRQMMIGNDDAHAERMRRIDARVARDAVVDRDDQRRRVGTEFLDDAGR